MGRQRSAKPLCAGSNPAQASFFKRRTICYNGNKNIYRGGGYGKNIKRNTNGEESFDGFAGESQVRNKYVFYASVAKKKVMSR